MNDTNHAPRQAPQAIVQADVDDAVAFAMAAAAHIEPSAQLASGSVLEGTDLA